MNILNNLPLKKWLKNYDSASFSKDCIAGIIVTIVLVPQGMAYALLAGVPAEYGLYCSIVPTFLYSLLGSSRHISVAPAALISIMIASAVGSAQPETDAQYLHYAVISSFLTGLFLIIMRLLHFGHVTRFISLPVISGFTSASAIIIASSQIKYMIGADIPNGIGFFETIRYLLDALPNINFAAVIMGVSCCVALWFFKKPWETYIKALDLKPWFKQMLAKSGPLLVVFIAAITVKLLALNSEYDLSIVGVIPKGLPQIQWVVIDLDAFQTLALPSFFIALMCFLISVAAGNNLAAKRREKLNANQELLALGAANIGAAFFGTFSLAGSLSRSAISYNAGSETTIASMVSALGVLLTLLFLTPLFYFLPLVCLGAIVIMSVVSMIELRLVFDYWKINRADAISLIITFVTVLIFGIEVGVAVGIICSIVLLIQRASHPHIAVLGRVGNSEHFRNIKRHEVSTHEHVLVVRVDESIYFANVEYIENALIELCEYNKQTKHIVLVCSSVSFIDATAVVMLDALVRKLKQYEMTLHLAEVKGPVMDQINNTPLLESLKPGRIFLNTHEAVVSLSQ